MTDYKLPVLRRLTADEVEPGMTIAGTSGDLTAIGVANHRGGTFNAGAWRTNKGTVLGYVSHGYDLLAEAPKPPITLPKKRGAVIRYRAPEGHWEIAHRVGTLFGTWYVDGNEELFDDEGILARMNPDGFEVATWTKPGDQK